MALSISGNKRNTDLFSGYLFPSDITRPPLHSGEVQGNETHPKVQLGYLLQGLGVRKVKGRWIQSPAGISGLVPRFTGFKHIDTMARDSWWQERSCALPEVWQHLPILPHR